MKKSYENTDDYIEDCEKLNDMVVDAIDKFATKANEESKVAKALIVAPVLFALLADHFEWHFYKNEDDIKAYANHFEGILKDWVNKTHPFSQAKKQYIDSSNIEGVA